MTTPTTLASIERRIWLIRDQRVMLDTDLAEIYGVTTKRLNEQVKRNADRFPRRFAFRLSASETRAILRSQNATLGRGRYTKHAPLAFTEHGAVMLACVLKSRGAASASLQVVDAFVRLRALVAELDGLGRKVEGLEKRADGHDQEMGRIFKVLNDIVPAEEPGDKKRIGFTPP